MEKKRAQFRHQIRRKAHQKIMQDGRKKFHQEQEHKEINIHLQILVGQHINKKISIIQLFHSLNRFIQDISSSFGWEITQRQLIMLNVFSIIPEDHESYHLMMRFIYKFMINYPEGHYLLLNALNTKIFQTMFSEILEFFEIENFQEISYNLEILQNFSKVRRKNVYNEFYLTQEQFNRLLQIGIQKKQKFQYFQNIISLLGLVTSITQNKFYEDNIFRRQLGYYIFVEEKQKIQFYLQKSSFRQRFIQALNYSQVKVDDLSIISRVFEQNNIGSLTLLFNIVYYEEWVLYQDIKHYLLRFYKENWQRKQIHYVQKIIKINYNILVNDLENYFETCEEIIQDIGWEVLQELSKNVGVSGEFQHLIKLLLRIRNEEIRQKLTKIAYNMITFQSLQNVNLKTFCCFCEIYKIGNLSLIKGIQSKIQYQQNEQTSIQVDFNL